MAEQRENIVSHNINEITRTFGHVQVPVDNASTSLASEDPASSYSERTSASQSVRKPSLYPTDSNDARRNKTSPSQCNGLAGGYSDRQRIRYTEPRTQQKQGDQHERTDFESSADLQRVATMVKGIRAVETEFEDVLRQLNSLLRTQGVDTEKIHPLCNDWIILQRAFSKITQDSNKLASRGAQTIEEFCQHCDLVASADCPLEEKIQELRVFKEKLEREGNILSARGEAMYDIDSAINDLRRDVQGFGFKLANVRQPIDKNLIDQIASLEAEITTLFQEVKTMKQRLLKRGGGIKVLLSAFFVVDLQRITDDAETLTDGIKNQEVFELDKKREELEDALNNKINAEKSWNSVSCKCSEQIMQISGQLGVISDIWKALSADVLRLELQLDSNVRDDIAPYLFDIKLQTTRKMYQRLYHALITYVRNEEALPISASKLSSDSHTAQASAISLAVSRSHHSSESRRDKRTIPQFPNLPTSNTLAPAERKIKKQPSQHSVRNVNDHPVSIQASQSSAQSSRHADGSPKSGKPSTSSQTKESIPIQAGDQPIRTSRSKRILGIICCCFVDKVTD